MVREAKLIEEGRSLIQAINKSHHLEFALWYTNAETQQTCLAMGSKLFDEKGPKEAYTRINAELSKLKDIRFLKFDMIKRIPLDSELGKSLKNTFGHLVDDSITGVFSSPNLDLLNVYAYGLSAGEKLRTGSRKR